MDLCASDGNYPQIRIASIYSSFPDCIGNGRRAYLKERVSAEDMQKAFALLQEHGLKPRLTCTNMLLQPKDFENEYLASMLEAAAHADGEIIVYSDEFAAYVRNRWGMPCVLSTTRRITDVDEFNRLAQSYDFVVLDYRAHNDPAFLSRIKRPENAEVMVNEFCQRTALIETGITTTIVKTR